MLGKAIVNTALKEEISLIYDSKPVATIHKEGFDGPTVSAKCTFVDQKTAEQMLKARQFDGWIQDQANKGKMPTSEEIAATMTKIGLENKYHQMRHGKAWTIKDMDGVVTAIDIVDMDNAGLEWRAGKVISRPKNYWWKMALNFVYFIIFLIVITFIHNSISN